MGVDSSPPQMDNSALGEEARRLATQTVGELLVSATAINQRLESVLAEFDAEAEEYTEVYERLSRSNSHCPIGRYTDYHTNDWSTGGFFLSPGPQQPPNTDAYRALSDDEKAALSKRWHFPVAQATESHAKDAAALFADVAGRAVILRRLSGFRETLDQLGEALQPPWSQAVNMSKIEVMMPAWAWRANLPLIHPLYKRINALRSANLTTLRITQHKISRIVAILRGASLEIPLSTLLLEPAPIPHTLIVTTIGENAQISDSAIGGGASVET